MMFHWKVFIFIIGLYLHKTVQGDLCWTFTTCADPDPSVSISVNEHTSVGTLLWQANATDGGGSDAGVQYTLVGYDKPDSAWTCLGLSSAGALTVTDSLELDYETLTNDSASPHAILLINATDSFDNYTTAFVNITLVDIAETPTFTSLPGAISLPENQTLNEEIYEANYTDPDVYLGETYSFTLATTPETAPFSINQTTGVISVDVDPCFDYDVTPSYSLFVVLSDGTFTIVGTVTVTITDHPNYTPSFDNLPTAVSVSESEVTGTAVFTVQATDGNPCDVITFDLVTTGVPFALDSTTGQLTTTGSLDYESVTSYTLTINASDWGLATDTQILTIDIQDEDEIPTITASPSTVSVIESDPGGQVLFTLEYSDPENVTLTPVLSVTPPAPLSISVVNSTVSEILLDSNPSLDFENITSYIVTVTISDGTYNESVTVTLTVLDVAEEPIFTNLPDTVTIAEETAVSGVLFSVTFTDQDMTDVITASLVDISPNTTAFSCSSSGDITVGGGVLFDYETDNQYNLTIEITDSTGLSVNSTLTVNITDVDEAPVISNLPVTVNVSEDSTGAVTLLTVSASDPEGNAVTYSISSTDPLGAPFTETGGGVINIDASPNLNYDTTASYNLTIDVSDGTLESSSYVIVDIINEDRAPVIVPITSSIVILENETLSEVIFTIDFSDEDINENWTFDLVGTDPVTAAFICNQTTGNVSFIDNPGFDFETVSQYILNVSVTDSSGLSDYQSVTVDIGDVNEPPDMTGTPSTASVSEDDGGGTVVVTAVCQDQEGDELVFSMTSNPPGAFVINNSSGDVTTINNPGLDYETDPQYNLTITCTDNNTLSDVSFVMVDLTDVQEAPVLLNVPTTVSVFENDTGAVILIQVNATDEDVGDILTYNITDTYPSAMSLFTIDNVTGDVDLMASPSLDYETQSEYILTIEVTDSSGLSVSGNLTVSVLDVNEAPQVSVTPSSMSLAEDDMGGTILLTAVCQDQEGDELEFNLTSSPSGPFMIDSNTGDISIASNPGLDYETDPLYNLTVTCTDNNTLSDSSLLTIDINDTAETPSILNLPNNISVFENETGGTILIQVSTFDEDFGDVLSYNISDAIPYADSMALFSIDNVTGDVELVVNPNLDYETQSEYLLTIEVTDSTGLSVSGNLTVTVLDVNEEPEVVNLPNTTSVYDGSTGGDIVYVVDATDQDNDALTYNITDSDPSGAPFSVNDTGHVSLDFSHGLDHFSVAEYTLSVTVSDGFLSDTETLNVTILNTLDPPEFVNLTDLSVGELSIGLVHTFQFTDPDRENVTSQMTILGQPSNSPFDLSSTGDLSVISPGLDYETTPFYTFNITLTDDSGLTTSMEVNVTIIDENEAPVFSVHNITMSIDEEQATGTVINTGVVSTDMDTIDISYYNLTEEGALYFDVVANDSTDLMIIAIIDRDLPNSVTKIILGVTVTDKGGLQDTMYITFEITDTNDNSPRFDTSTLTASVAEDVAIGTVVIQVLASDIDEGVNQNIHIFEAVTNQYLQIASDGTIQIESELDYERESTITYVISASDGGSPQRSSTTTFTLTVIDVYEPGPIFQPTFYSWELFEDASVDELAGTVLATSYDGTPVTYSFDVNQGEFSLDASSGQIAVESSLQSDNKYVLYVTATDTQYFPQTGSTIIRIDTYNQQTYLITFFIQKALSEFTQSYVLNFKNLLDGIIPSSEPRVIYINNQRWLDYNYFNASAISTSSRRRLLQNDLTSLTLLFLKNNNSDALQNLDSEKELYTTDSLMQLLTTDGESSPNEYFSGSTFTDYPITSITPYIEEEEPTENWWLDTTAGLATTITLSIVGAILLILLVVLIVVLCKRHKKKKQRVFDPSEADNTAVEKEDMKLVDVPTVYTSPPRYSQVGIAKPWEAPWESYKDREVVCKPPPLGTTSGKGGRKQTKFHSHATDVFDDDGSENGSRSITPVSELRSVSQNDAVSVQEVRASLVTPIAKK